ncbi:hypothetical protein NUW54_g1075 [Trametes sanguinea]|uniref:Uncharacterized protein n=1 Tax=Trametes sanguinea TaxID=158606 RepID=A0ACC1Q8Q5_9APHY|nr:hypothetical protein NUW54_g1075 [Trametes sanguinea]
MALSTEPFGSPWAYGGDRPQHGIPRLPRRFAPTCLPAFQWRSALSTDPPDRRVALRNLEIVNCSSRCFACHSAAAPHALGMALDFLRNHHSLESLRLSQVACQEPNEADTSLEAVELNSLQNLTLDALLVTKSHGWNFPPALIHAMSLHDADKLLVEVLDTFVPLTYLTDGTALPGSLVGMLTKLEVRIFRITVKRRFLKDARMRTLLTAFPHLVSLTTQGSWRPVGLTRHFAELSSEPTLAEPLCSDLRILNIRWKIHPLNVLTVASFYAHCERMKNNLEERSRAAGRVLDLLD